MFTAVSSAVQRLLVLLALHMKACIVSGSPLFKQCPVQSHFAGPTCRANLAEPTCAGSMNWTTYLWFLLWLVISAAVYSLYSVHNVEVPYAPVDSPVQRCAFPCARAEISRLQRSEKAVR